MTSAGAEAVWRPSIAFLRRGRAPVRDEGGEGIVAWRFSDLRLHGLPLCYVECEIEGFGLRTTGLGDGFTFAQAATRALAEAWERLWMHRLSRSTRPDISSSNGFAAGRTTAEASSRARGECIERAALMSAWERQKGWIPTRLASLTAKLMAGVVAQRGWTLDIYRLRATERDDILVGLARHQVFGAAFDAKEAAAGAGERGLLRSLLRTIAVQERREVVRSWSLARRAEPEDHMRFYRDPAHLPAFDFLKDAAACDGPLTAGCERLRTTVVCGAGALPAVAYAENPAWPKLGWGLDTVKGGNPWPHPLA